VHAAVADLYLPPAVFKTCPWQQRALIETGLRQWLRCCAPALRDDKVIGMPSRAVDEAWHGLILCTVRYSAFCKKAYGQFLHHHPEGGAPPTLSRSQIQPMSSFAGQSSHGRWSRRQVSSVFFGISTNVSVWTSPGASTSPGSLRFKQPSQHWLGAARIREATMPGLN
jgi:hypothetical protein